MFHLTEAELSLRMVGCGDGPASFNAHMRQQSRRVISCDPLYQLTARQIQNRIAATYENVIGQTRQPSVSATNIGSIYTRPFIDQVKAVVVRSR